MKRLIETLIILILFAATLFGQNIGVGTVTPDASAVLDITSPDKGILIPRLSTNQREMIANPATGLLVFDTTTASFWFYNAGWAELTTQGYVQNQINAILFDIADLESIDDNLQDQIDNHNTNDLDLIATNEIQNLSISGNDLSLTLGNTVTLPSTADNLGNHTAAQDLDMANNQINNLTDPTLSTDAATKSYVDAHQYIGDEIKDADDDTKIQVEKILDEDKIRFVIEGTEVATLTENELILSHENNLYIGQGNRNANLVHANANTAIGNNAFGNNVSGVSNTAVGHNSLAQSNTGLLNTAIGAASLQYNESGSQNCGFGPSSMRFNKTGNHNVGIGSSAYERNVAGSRNVAVGYRSGSADTLGQNNVYLGAEAGGTFLSGERDRSHNIFIGYQAGEEELGSNKLYIESSDSTTPLIWGDFQNDSVKIHGVLGIKDAFVFPDTDGTTNQILKTDGSGIVSWQDEINGFQNISGVVSSTGGVDDDFVFGDTQLPNNGISVNENLLFFDESKGAFRVGQLLNSDNWSPDSLGVSSFSAGKNTKASGDFSVALGTDSRAEGSASMALGNIAKATGLASVAMGDNTVSSGIGSLAGGSMTDALGNYSFAHGFSTLANGHNSTALGFYTDASSYASVAIGRYNVGGGSQSGWSSTDPLFEIGIGTSDINKENAVTVLKNGTVKFKDYEFPNVDGLANQVLQTDGSGLLSWSSLNDDDATNELLTSVSLSGNVISLSDAGGVKNQDLSSIIPHSIEDDQGDTNVQFNSTDNKILFTSNNVVTAKIEPDSMYLDGSLRVGAGAGAKMYIGNSLLQSSNASILRCAGSFRPFDDNANSLGSNGKRWTAVWAVNGTIQTSDKRLKKNIAPLTYGLSEVLKMKSVDYHWNEETESDQKHIGIIAQEIQELIPEVIVSGEKEGDYLGVKYAELVPVLIKAIQEQNETIVSLQSQLDELNTSVNRMEASQSLEIKED